LFTELLPSNVWCDILTWMYEMLLVFIIKYELRHKHFGNVYILKQLLGNAHIDQFDRIIPCGYSQTPTVYPERTHDILLVQNK
jgi:hypothetical protein